VAFVPVGPLEYHGPHLPLGVDPLIAEGLCARTAAITGGVVLPPIHVSAGVLPLRFGVAFDLGTLRSVVRTVLEDLAGWDIRAIVLFSGHGALDHLHVMRQECDRLMELHADTYALMAIWNELTVEVEGDIHDHGAKVETSYMLELFPETVDLDALSDDPAADHVGVYAANPRFTASRGWGAKLAEHAVAGLTDRVRSMLAGQRPDNWSDLRALVGRLQAGDLEVHGARLADNGTPVVELFNPHDQSKYVTAVEAATWDGEPVDPAPFVLVNPSVGETGTERRVGDLDPLSGFYVRRNQTCRLLMNGVRGDPGPHRLALELELAGVMTIGAAGEIDVETVETGDDDG